MKQILNKMKHLLNLQNHVKNPVGSILVVVYRINVIMNQGQDVTLSHLVTINQ